VALFRRSHDGSSSDVTGVAGLAETARARGWQAVDGRPLDATLPDAVAETLQTMYGFPTGMDTWERKAVRIGETVCHDAYRLVVDGRGIVVTNAWANIQPAVRGAPDDFKGVAVCAVELPTMLPLACIQPRRFKAVLRARETPTGDATFDEQFQVFGQLVLDQPPALPDELKHRIAARDDWVFRFVRAWVGCISLGPFQSADEVVGRIDEVLGVVAAIPTSVMPDHVDHSQDDLIARATKLQSIDEAMAFLQGLTDEERDRLRSSTSPLAPMADARTPAEAMARFKDLDQQQQLQLYSMVQHVKGAER
jgi:hypothetical protein